MSVFPDRSAPSWKELQRCFADVLLGGEDAALRLDEWLEGPGLSVHRNTILFGLLDALTVVFPVVQRLVGASCFRALVRAFFRAHPARVPCLVDAGEGFPAFLGEQDVLAGMPWLMDVAALEWDCHSIGRCKDSSPLDPSVFNRFDPLQVDDLVFLPRPASRLFSSLWPVDAIRRVHLEHCDDCDVPEVSLDEGPEFLLLIRPGRDVLVEDIGQAGSVFLQRCFSGECFGDAASGTLDLHPDFDLQVFLLRALNGGWFAEADLRGGWGE